MNATSRHADPSSGRGGSDAAVRGALLIAVAVVIGVLLLWRGHDADSATTVTDAGDTPTATAPEGSPDTAPESTEGGGEPVEPTSPPPSTHAPGEVKVLVANGTGTRGGAGTVTNKLIPFAYATLPAADADRSDIAESVVYFREGYQEDARQIAIQLGVPEENAASIVKPMPAEPPVRGTQGTENAANTNVLVVLGTDQVIKQS